MSTQDQEPRLPAGTKRSPVMLSVVRWLMEDTTRTLPQPDDEDGIKQLAQAIDKSPESIRALMAQLYGGVSDEKTRTLLT